MLFQAMPKSGDNPLVPAPQDFIVVTICFLILLFLIWKFVIPKFEETYQERKEAIEGGLQKAEKAQKEAQEVKEQYTKQLEDAKEESVQIREKARVEGAQIIAESREQAHIESQRILTQAQKQIMSEKENAERDLKTDVGSLASTLATKVVGESLTDDDRANRVIDRFLDEIESGKVQSKN